MPFSLPEELKVVEALTPAADAAGRTGDYVSLKNVLKAWVVVHLDQGNAATAALTLHQATAVAATAEKVLANAVPIWANQDCAASDAMVRQTDAVSFTTSAAVKHKIVIFQVDPALLDVNNGFDCLTVKTGASNAGNITSAQYYLETRYAGAAIPSVITD